MRDTEDFLARVEQSAREGRHLSPQYVLALLDEVSRCRQRCSPEELDVMLESVDHVLEEMEKK